MTVIGYSKEEEQEAEYLAELAEKVYYLPMYEQENKLHAKIEVLPDAKPVAIEKGAEQLCLRLEEGSIETDGIFILRESIATSQLVPGLAMDSNQVIVNRQLETNLPGLFACGDVTGAPYQYIKAAGEGNVAALTAVSYLAKSRNSNK